MMPLELLTGFPSVGNIGCLHTVILASSQCLVLNFILESRLSSTAYPRRTNVFMFCRDIKQCTLFLSYEKNDLPFILTFIFTMVTEQHARCNFMCAPLNIILP